MKPKFTDEQLSRILSAHEQLQLIPLGESWNECISGGCINQVAYLIHTPGCALVKNFKSAEWFDNSYRMTWSTDRLLRELTNQGLV